MEIEYHVQIWKEGDQFIAHAMPLDVASSGSSPEAARQALDEAVRLFLRTAAESTKYQSPATTRMPATSAKPVPGAARRGFLSNATWQLWASEPAYAQVCSG